MLQAIQIWTALQCILLQKYGLIDSNKESVFEGMAFKFSCFVLKYKQMSQCQTINIYYIHDSWIDDVRLHHTSCCSESESC